LTSIARTSTKLGIFGLEDYSHAAVAKNFEDPITAEPAQFIGSLGRGQKVNQMGFMRRTARVSSAVSNAG
jgi:hypothetical protein